MARPAADIPLSLAHLCELELPPAPLVDVAARAGFASIGLRTHRAAPGGVEHPLRDPAERRALRRRLSDAGVTVLYVEMISLSETLDVESCRPTIEIGAEIGATRLAVAGDSAALDVVAEQMAALCDIARPLGMAVDIEFMPFRAVRDLAAALEVVRRAVRPNAHVLLDALHMFRSGSPLDALRRADRAALGTFQICDAPLSPPPPDQLVVEARTNRLLPGRGGLDLAGLIDALPDDIAFGVEVPLASRYPSHDPVARATLLARETRAYLQQRNA